jgi:Phosphotransferase enzyme family
LRMQPNLGMPNDGHVLEPWLSVGELSQDPALPALGAFRSVGLAAALPGLALTHDKPVEVRLCNYVVGSRATFEVRTGDRRFALKLYAEDPSREVELYRRLARAGFARDYGARVPRLLVSDARLQVLVLTWFEGPTASSLIRDGKGALAGRLAATWLWHVSRKRLRFGPPRGRAHMLYKAGRSVGALGAVQPALGVAARKVANTLLETKLAERPPNLVHGTFYARHIFDLGDVPGVIDWHYYGLGPVEIDGGMFLATLSRQALRHESAAAEVERAKESFLDRVRNLVDFRALEWYWAAGLLHLAATGLKTARTRDVPAEASAVIDEAARHAQAVVEIRSAGGGRAPPRARFRTALRPRSMVREQASMNHDEEGGPGPPDGSVADRRK